MAKTVVITGANSGIGFETARQLASRGDSIVMVCRDSARGESARLEIAKEATGRAPALFLADLSSQESIRSLAAALREQYKSIDVLINNAGGIFAERVLSVDGIEKTFATNHLASFLLTHLLLDRIQAAPEGRIINITSSMHNADVAFLDDLQCERRYGFMRAYRFSKLGVILFSYELARRMKGTHVCVNCVEPGPTKTHFGDNMRGLPGLFPFLMKRIPGLFRTAAESAGAIAYLASSTALDSVTGEYFVKRRTAKSARITYDAAIAARHWMLSAALTGLAPNMQPSALSLVRAS